MPNAFFKKPKQLGYYESGGMTEGGDFGLPGGSGGGGTFEEFDGGLPTGVEFDPAKYGVGGATGGGGLLGGGDFLSLILSIGSGIAKEILAGKRARQQRKHDKELETIHTTKPGYTEFGDELVGDSNDFNLDYPGKPFIFPGKRRY